MLTELAAVTPFPHTLSAARNAQELVVSSAMDKGGDTVRSVERALAILQAMNRRPVSSVDYLHKTTNLPKSTLVRLLRTMVKAGYITNDARQAGYQITSLVTSLSCGFHGDPLVVQAAQSWAVNLTRQLKWPVGIAVFDEDAVVIRYSTVADSPMSPFHATINMRLSLFSRALGRAYLAYCGDEQLSAIVTRCAESDDPENALARDSQALTNMIQHVRSAGYAIRDRQAEPRNSNTIAMPIMVDGEARASIGFTYFRSAIRSWPALQHCIEALRNTTDAISVEIERLQSSERQAGLDGAAISLTGTKGRTGPN